MGPEMSSRICGLNIANGVCEPLPLRGFPAGKARIRQRAAVQARWAKAKRAKKRNASKPNHAYPSAGTHNKP